MEFRAAGEVHVLMKDCRADYAVTNATQLIELLAEPRPVARRTSAAARYG